MKTAVRDQSRESETRESAIHNLLSITNWIKNKANQELKPFGITPQQYRVLKILEANTDKGLSTNQIKEHMFTYKSDISRMIERMVKKKLIIRKINKQDKRLVDIRLGKAGEDILERLQEDAFRLENIISVLDEAEVEALDKLLSKIKSSQDKT